MRKWFVVALVGAVFFPSVMSSTPQQAYASVNPNSVAVYLDAPFVQGSYVTGAGTTSADFNLAGTDCNDQAPTGTQIFDNCKIFDVENHGGASVGPSDSDPSIGGSGSRFPSTWGGTNVLRITMAESKYIGLWWSAGDNRNIIRFYRDNKLLLEMGTGDILALLGPVPSSGTNSWVARNNDNAANVVTPIGPLSDTVKPHRKVWYFGNPRGYVSGAAQAPPADGPTAESTINASEPFVYLHFFANGTLAFDEVRLAGGGFEFDNLVISTVQQTPASRLVLLDTIGENHTVAFVANADEVEGTMANQTANTSTALRSNTFTRAGFTFAGWNTQANGGGTNYAEGASYNFFADLTLYAQWVPIPTQNTPTNKASTHNAVSGVPQSPQLASTGVSEGAHPIGIAGLMVSGVLLVLYGYRRQAADGSPNRS